MAKATGSIIVAANPNTAGAEIFIDDGQGTSTSKVTLKASTGTGAPSVFSRGADSGNDINLGLRFSTSTSNTRPALYMRMGGTSTSWQYSTFEDDWGLDGDRPAKLIISDTVGSKIAITFSTGTSGTSGSAIFTGTNSVARKVSTGVYEVNGDVASNASGYRMYAIGKCIQDAIDNDGFDVEWQIKNTSGANQSNSSSDGNLNYYILYLRSPQSSDLGNEHAGVAVGLERASGSWTASSGTDFMTVTYSHTSSAFSGTSRMASIDGPNEASYAAFVGPYKSTDNGVALSAAELANEIKNLINALPIAVSATVDSTTVSLTNDAHGTDGNVSITTSDSTNFSVSGMSGGSAEGGGGGGGGTSIMARSRIGSKLIAIGGITKNNISSGSVNIGHLDFAEASVVSSSMSGEDRIVVQAKGGSARAVTLDHLEAYLSASVLTDLTASGDVILGDGTGDDINVVGRLISGLVPKNHEVNDLGTEALSWNVLYAKSGSFNGAVGVQGGLEVVGTADFKGSVDLGDASVDTITVNGRFDSDLIADSDAARKLGSSGVDWSELHVATAYINQLGEALDANNQAITNIDVNSGAIDGITLGTNSAVTQGVITSLTASFAKIDSLEVDEIVSRTVTKDSLEIKDNLIIAGVSGSKAGDHFGAGFQLGGTVGVEGTGSNPLMSMTLGTRGLTGNALVINVDGQEGASFASGSTTIAALGTQGMRFGVTGSISGSLIQAKRIEAGHLSLRGALTSTSLSGATVNAGALNVIGGKSILNHVDINDSLEVAGYAGFAGTVAISGALSLGTPIATAGIIKLDNMATGSVQTPQLGALSVTHAKIAVGAVTVDNLATGSVQTPQVLDGAITHAKLAVGAATVDNLATGSVQTPQILDGAVTHAKLAVGAATVDNLATGSVQTAQVLDGAITHGKLAVGAVNHDNVATGSIEGAHLSDKVILNASDAHGGLVLSSNKLSVGFRKVVFVRADGSNISGSVPTKDMFADKAVPTPYTTASLSAECQSGSLMVYLNGVLLHGDHPGQNAHGPTSADFRLATASNDYKVLLNEDLALDADDILTVTYLSGALS